MMMDIGKRKYDHTVVMFILTFVVCIGCHDLTILCLIIRDITIMLKLLIIVVLFIILTNLKQLFYYKILCFKIVGRYIKDCQTFGLA